MNVNYRKTLAVGGTAAAILGLGGTALATSGSDITNGSASSAAAKDKDKPNDKPKDKQAGNKLLKRLEHGRFVTKGKDKTVTHTIFRGTVTAVSPTSVTVKAEDGTSQSFVVGKDTAIRERTKGKKPVTSSIAKIAKGDRVVATGTGTSTVTAKHVIELPER